jgi:hypothetical protein
MFARSARWAILALVLGAGCSSSSSPGPPVPIDPSVKGLDVLGAGTDVFGAYAVESNVKGRLLDVEALNAAGLLVYNPNVEEYRYEERNGHTMSSYVSQLSASLGLSGSFMFFSAELQTSFANDTYRRDDYSYASIVERHWKHSVRVEPGVWGSGVHLRPYLTTLARQAIDDTDAVHGHWSGEELIAAYGTHVINGLYVGARLDYHLAIQIMDEQHRTSLSAFVKAKYGSTFASAGLESDISSETYAAMNSYQQVGPVINAKGGASQYAHPEDDAQYQLWKASIDGNPVYCGIIDGGLLGIWELAPTAERRQEILAAFEAYAAEKGAAFVPLVEKITHIHVANAGQGTSVTLPTPGHRLLRSLSGDTVGGHANLGIWKDTVQADHVYVSYLSEVTAAPVGVAEVHIASTDPATSAWLFGGLEHDAIYGEGAPGCTANAAPSQDLNSGTCFDASIWDWYSGWCAYWFWSATCRSPGTPLFLHSVVQTPDTEPIRCLVIGDEVAVDANQPLATRRAHIYWGPDDVNHDGRADAADADWVLAHVNWVRNETDGGLVNLNHGTQSYHRYDWYDCGLDEGYDEAWLRPRGDPADAQFLGYCLP